MQLLILYIQIVGVKKINFVTVTKARVAQVRRKLQVILGHKRGSINKRLLKTVQLLFLLSLVVSIIPTRLCRL
jgi:hypothetical protein